MKRLKGIVGTILAAAIVTAFAGCASVPKLTGSEKIAVVNFALEKSIVRQGQAPDNGPGLLNDKAEDYYQYHKESVAKAWNVFKGKAPEIFGAGRLVDIGSVEGNAELLGLTAPVSRMVMGKETAPAFSFVYPEGLNYFNIYDAKLAAKVFSATKADVLVSITLKAEYAMSKGVGIGTLAVGRGRMIVTATIVAVNAQGKFLRTGRIQAFSTEDASITGTAMDPADYPRLMASAQEDLNAKLAKQFAYW